MSCSKAISRGSELTKDCKYAIYDEKKPVYLCGIANRKNIVFKKACDKKWQEIRDKQ